MNSFLNFCFGGSPFIFKEFYFKRLVREVLRRRVVFCILILVFSLYFLFFCSFALAVDGGSGDAEGAHNLKVPGLKDSLCKRCHFSKRSKGLKIWEDPPKGAETIPGTKGMRTICQSCHYPGNAVNAISGFSLGTHPLSGHEYRNGNVFMNQSDPKRGEDHVMHDWANIDPKAGKLPAEINPAFPMKEEDEWGHPVGKGDAENKGFYCGTCHDPHKQPNEQTDGSGDYLRVKEGGAVGKSDDRTQFCMQCHQDLPEYPQHGVSIGCLNCHHPHDGFVSIEENPVLGQWILSVEVNRANFRALPNVPGFGTQKDGTDVDISSVCYGCHSPNRPDVFSKLGYGIISGDDTNVPREHHPMGNRTDMSMLLHADGIEFPSPEGQLTCTSCHNGFHSGGYPYYLRFDFTEDSADFCAMCHQDKGAEDLGAQEGVAHRQGFGRSPNGRGNCMFCHFIHDGQGDRDQALPAIEALIRIKPKNLAWSTKEEDNDALDYEDICYGCHGDVVFMKGSGANGAMLRPDLFASHPISGTTNAVKPTGGFLVSDGPRSENINDYGVPSGEIYCGSCHNVHRARKRPYLRVDNSPYSLDGFCEGCHSEHPVNGASSHPIGVGPNPEKSLAEFPEPLYGGGSGVSKGITAGNTKNGKILCLTCHNVHAANTTKDGNLRKVVKIDKKGEKHGHLLCVDNFSSEMGSDLCRLCHEPFEAIVYSRHNFSNLNLGEVSSRGVCSVCHTPHRTKDKQLLWPRSLSEERIEFSQRNKPNYVPGVTIFCYDCHEDEYSLDNDPPINAFFYPPKDIAFTDGPGISSKVGFYDTIPPGANPRINLTKTGGHFISTEGITELRHGIETGDKLPCNLCHDPHGVSNNQVFLKKPLGVNTKGGLEASTNTRNGTGTGREICVSCHGYIEDVIINIPIKIYDFEVIQASTAKNIKEHSKDSDVPCTNCHLHNRIVPFQNPRHRAHPKDCKMCHQPELAYTTGSLKFIDDKQYLTTSVCQPCHSAGGSYDGVSDPVIGAKFNWSDSPYNSNGTLKLGKEKWCVGCHDEEPSVIWTPGSLRPIVAPNIVGNNASTQDGDQGSGFYQTGHGLAPYRSYQDTKRRGADLTCTDCHDPNAPHIGIEPYDAEKDNYRSGYRLRSINGKEPMKIPRRQEEYSSGDFNLCFSCHNEESIIGLGFGFRTYSNNQNPFFMVEEVKTDFKNVDLSGLNRHNLTRGPTFDFINYYPSNNHWNHLALPNAEVKLSTSQGGGVERINRCVDSRCHEKIVWDSDMDGWLDSRPSCTTCHNPHGTKYPSMTKNDLAITHNRPDVDWEYGFIGSRNYGVFGNGGDDLYCSECHAKLMRYGEGNYSYYREIWIGEDYVIPEPPR